jgi:VWFA-related protein
VQATYAAIGEFVKRMAPLPGQRTLILVSSGFLNIERDSLNTESRIIDFAVQSNVTISSLDARGLYTTEMTASEHSPALSGQSFQVNSDYHRSAMRLAENPLSELANGTGGTFFHNSNDVNAGLKELVEAPMYVYLLELSLDGVKQNGTYHALNVKVDREGSQVEARRGYFMPKPQKQKK